MTSKQGGDSVRRSRGKNREGKDQEHSIEANIDEPDRQREGEPQLNACLDVTYLECAYVYLDVNMSARSTSGLYNPKYLVSTSAGDTGDTGDARRHGPSPKPMAMFPNYHPPEAEEEEKRRRRRDQRRLGTLTGKATGHRLVADLVTVLALSLHSFLEGMAVGLEDLTIDVWTLSSGTHVIY